jgi:hypothetical protein
MFCLLQGMTKVNIKVDFCYGNMEAGFCFLKNVYCAVEYQWKSYP